MARGEYAICLTLTADLQGESIYLLNVIVGNIQLADRGIECFRKLLFPRDKTILLAYNAHEQIQEVANAIDKINSTKFRIPRLMRP